jgi:hypothetical protein
MIRPPSTAVLNVDRIIDGVFKSGYPQLRADGQTKDLYCIDANNHIFGSGAPLMTCQIAYTGTLRVLCVPLAAVFDVGISDTYTPPRAAPDPFAKPEGRPIGELAMLAPPRPPLPDPLIVKGR